MKGKFLIMAIISALMMGSGTFAYTWSTVSAGVAGEAGVGDIATVELAPNQPDWESVIPTTEVAVETLRPDAAGDNTNIPEQYPASGEHWDKVAEAEADDFSTYVSTVQTSYAMDLYNIADSSIGTGTIHKLTVYFCISGDDGGGVGYAKALVKTYGTVYPGSEETQTGKTFDIRSYEWTTNPDTGVAWTWDEINALQIGIELKSGSDFTNAYCTQVYAEISYETEPITQGPVPTGDLFLISPNVIYSGDLQVKVYLTNVAALTKAYNYLSMALYLEGSVEAGQVPNYRVLSLTSGVATFNLLDVSGGTCTLSLISGSYELVSAHPEEWEEGWSVTPELYCEVVQR